tara:strand:+ start:125 stop:607 length:483 start_codon:yes stop_codon:yes gene_type:complete
LAKGKPLSSMFEDLTTTQKMNSFGNDMVNRIIKRTQKGLDVFSKKFKKYSKGYYDRKKTRQIPGQANQFAPRSRSDVNLTLTGNMLNSFQVQAVNDKSVTIGFRGDEAQKAFRNEENKRIIADVKAPVSKDDEKFIARFFDKQLVKAMKESSGKTEIVIG